MKGHAAHTLKERENAIEDLRKEILGGRAKGPYEFAEDLKFGDKPLKDDPALVKRLKHAVRRDCRFGSANAAYIRLFGQSQGIRSIYDGARLLADGGAP